MTTGQVTLGLGSIALIAGIYFFGPLQSPEKRNPEKVAVASAIESDFDYDVYLAEELDKLPEEQKTKYFELRENMESGEDKISVLNEIVQLLEANDLEIPAAFVSMEIAALNQQWDKAAGDLYKTAFSSGNESLNQYILSNIVVCYEKVLEADPENTDAKINMAVAYMEGSTSNVMKGVMLLREITDNDPDNITANLILGRYGIISGQYDRAVQRLEKVLLTDSMNVEAYLYLAEAYEGLGNIPKAIEMLEQCKLHVKSPEFSDEIGKYIDKLKNS